MAEHASVDGPIPTSTYEAQIILHGFFFLKRTQCWDGVESLQGSGRSYEEERGVNTIKIYVHYETVEEYKCYILKIASVHTHQCFTLMGL